MRVYSSEHKAPKWSRRVARIYEQGNGFPGTGAHVQDLDGNLYRVTSESEGPIQTGQPGASNWLVCEVEEADWAELGRDDLDLGPLVMPFPALCVPNVHPGTRVEVQPPAEYVAEYLRGLGREWLVWTDVHPLFYQCPGLEADALAEWLVQQRPDLVDEIRDCLDELRNG